MADLQSSAIQKSSQLVSFPDPEKAVTTTSNKKGKKLTKKPPSLWTITPLDVNLFRMTKLPNCIPMKTSPISTTLLAGFLSCQCTQNRRLSRTLKTSNPTKVNKVTSLADGNQYVKHTSKKQQWKHGPNMLIKNTHTHTRTVWKSLLLKYTRWPKPDLR